jgi:glycosyltransferase involved in cell wall biosynthesis
MVIYVLASVTGGGLSQPGLSGGDRITIECIKRWAEVGHKIKLFIGRSGQLMYKRYGVEKTKNIEFIITSSFIFEKYSVARIIFFELLALIGGCASVLRSKPLDKKNEVIFSTSDFWPDAISGLILKLRNKEAKWIVGFYLFAPKPWQKDSPYKGIRSLIGLLFWLSQIPIYWLVKRYADMVFVTSEPDVEKFITNKRGRNKIVVVRGGVDIETSTKVPEPKKKKYDAVFIGRFHPQKGVLELIDIWRRVIKKKPKARLAMIGEGSLMEEVKLKIKGERLERNIDLLGFLDGLPKIKVFKSAKIVVHPATYDSGGMAPCEAMAAGLPGVSFDLEALRTYYPKGMLKTAKFNLDEFANNINRLLDNEAIYKKIKTQALAWAREWDWNKRADFLLDKIKEEVIDES